jgi:hypothetical protein
MIEKKKGQFQTLNIDPIFNDWYKKKYSKIGAYSLEELDSFTMQFDDEIELRKVLLDYDVVKIENITKPLSIRCLNKGQYSKVPYNFLYQKDMELVLDPTNLVELIVKRYYANDFLFIKKFSECFVNYHECAVTAHEVARYADLAIRYDTGNKYLSELDRNGNDMVQRLVKLLLFEYEELPNGYINYKSKLKYRNLHTMIAFINNYDMKHGIVESKGKILLEDIVPCLKPKTRTRVKDDELEGQISLFDAIDYEDK